MKRHKVNFRPKVWADLDGIYRFVYGLSRDPLTAGRFVDRIVAACDRLGDAPFVGRRRDDLQAGLRTFPFERRAVIAYFIEDGEVEIANVFYGGRDYEGLYASDDEEPTPD